MTTKKFLNPFANSGDKLAVPDGVQVDGGVSYAEGWGFNYSRDPTTDPLAKNVDRGATNQILYDITSALGQLQTQWAPEWITAAENGGAAYAYPMHAIVRYDADVWISQVAANVAQPGTDVSKWLPISAFLTIYDLAGFVTSTQYQRAAQVTAANVGGTADAITATFSPEIMSLTNGMTLIVRPAAANATPAPTFTPHSGVIAAAGIVKGNGLPLLPGDIAGPGHWLELQYDEFLAKWVLQNPAFGVASAAPVVGTARGLKCSVTAPAATAVWTADEIVVGSSGGVTYKLANVNKTINLATIGAGGLDAPAAAAGFVSIYAIYNPVANAVALLACDAATSVSTVYGGANMPAGYTASTLLGTWPTTGAGQFPICCQVGNRVSIVGAAVLSVASTTAAPTAVSLSSVVPKNAKSVNGNLQIGTNNGTVTPFITVSGSSTLVGGIEFGIVQFGVTYSFAPFDDIWLMSSQTLYYNFVQYSGSDSTAGIIITGYSI